MGNDQYIDKQELEHVSTCMRNRKAKDMRNVNLSENIVLDKHIHIHTQVHTNVSTCMCVYIYRHTHRHLSESGQKYLDKINKTSVNVPFCGCPMLASVQGKAEQGHEQPNLIGRHPCPRWGQRVRSFQTQALLWFHERRLFNTCDCLFFCRLQQF